MARQKYSDAARRCSETINAKLTFHGWSAVGRWVAIRLSDGGSDGVLYDTKADAVRHQLHEMQCVYVCITGDGMSPAAAESFLSTNRKLYEAGMRLSDPDTMVHLPNRKELLR